MRTGVFAAFSGGKIFSGFPGFSAPTQRGTRTAAGGFALTGGSFSAPESRGARTALAGSPFPGGEFFAEPQRGDSPSADGGSMPRPEAGTTPYPRRWAKRKGHLRFPFLFELLPFPCFLIWRRFPICDRFENRERQRIFSTVGEHSVLPCRNLYAVPDIVLLHMWVSLRRRGIAVPRNS